MQTYCTPYFEFTDADVERRMSRVCRGLFSNGVHLQVREDGKPGNKGKKVITLSPYKLGFRRVHSEDLKKSNCHWETSINSYWSGRQKIIVIKNMDPGATLHEVSLMIWKLYDFNKLIRLPTPQFPNCKMGIPIISACQASFDDN